MTSVSRWFKWGWFKRKPHSGLHLFVKDYQRDGYYCAFSHCSRFISSEEILKNGGDLSVNLWYGE